MIKPEELRIGNLIHGTRVVKGIRMPSGPPFQVVTIKFNGVECVLETDFPAQVEEWPWFTYTEIEPIPLTPEWLEKFGFHGIDDDGMWGYPDTDGDYVFQLEANYLVSENSFSHIWDAAYTGAPVEYIHQLQNLYYALTGSELLISDPKK